MSTTPNAHPELTEIAVAAWLREHAIRHSPAGMPLRLSLSSEAEYNVQASVQKPDARYSWDRLVGVGGTMAEAVADLARQMPTPKERADALRLKAAECIAQAAALESAAKEVRP